MKYLFITLICFYTGITTAQIPAATVPSFTFFKFDKTIFVNKNLAPGKFSFFVFFDATCDHCQHAIEYINTHYQEFKNTAMYLITLDEKNTVATFMNKHGKNLLNKKNVFILQDMNNEFVVKFGPKKYPSVFLYSAKQKLLLYSDDEKQLYTFTLLTNTAKL